MTHTEQSYVSEAEIDAIEALTDELMKPGYAFYPFSQDHLVEALGDVSRLDYARIEGCLTYGDERIRGKGIYEAAYAYWSKAAKEEAESQIMRARP